jgi:hypothetical protein
VANKKVTSRFVLKGDNQLSRSFAKAKKEMAQVGKAAGLMAAAAVAGGVAIVKKQAELIDNLGKTADAFGITTESLQALRHMADLTGVSSATLDVRLGKLQKNLGEIARRGGTMAEALEDAGLDIKDIINLPLDEQLEAVAGALSNVENQTIRASIASDLFGRDANRMLKMTDQLAKKGIKELADELEELGFSISRSEAAGVERMNDSMLTASRVGEGLAQQFTVALAPAIAAIAEEFIGAAKESDGFEEAVEDTVDDVVGALGFIADSVDSTGRLFTILANLGIVAFEALKFGALDLADSIVNGPNRALDSMLRLADKIPGVDIDFQFGPLAPGLQADAELSAGIIKEALAEIDAILLEPLPSAGFKSRLAVVREELAAEAAELEKGRESDGAGFTLVTPEEEAQLAKIQGMMDGLISQVGQFGMADEDRALLKLIDEGATEAQITLARQLFDELRLLKEEEQASKDATQARLDMEREYEALVSSTRTEVEAHALQVQAIVDMYAAGVIPSAEEYADVLARINDRFVESTRKVNELDQFGIQAARNMETAFADFLFEPWDDGLDNMLDSFVDTIGRMIAEAASAQILKAMFGDEQQGGGFANFLGGLFGGGGGSSGGGSSGAGFLSTGMGAIGGFFGGGMAAGGPVAAGVPYLVGEKGPELVMPRAAGTIVPNDQISRPVTNNTSLVINLPRDLNTRTGLQMADEVGRQQRLARTRNG